MLGSLDLPAGLWLSLWDLSCDELLALLSWEVGLSDDLDLWGEALLSMSSVVSSVGQVFCLLLQISVAEGKVGSYLSLGKASERAFHINVSCFSVSLCPRTLLTSA